MNNKILLSLNQSSPINQYLPLINISPALLSWNYRDWWISISNKILHFRIALLSTFESTLYSPQFNPCSLSIIIQWVSWALNCISVSVASAHKLLYAPLYKLRPWLSTSLHLPEVVVVVVGKLCNFMQRYLSATLPEVSNSNHDLPIH